MGLSEPIPCFPEPPDWLEEVLAEFGLGNRIAPAIRLSGGSADRVWKLTTDLGVWAVKESIAPRTDPPDQSRISAGVQFERVAWERGTPMPEPRLAVSGAPIHVVEEGASVKVLTVREWIDGQPVGWNETAAEREPAALLLSAGLARLHAIEWPSARPVSDWWSHSPGAARWAELVEKARHERAPWTDGIGDALPRLLAAEDIVAMPAQTSPLRMCHLDPNPHNVMRTKEGIALIDWDGAGLAPPEQEFAGVLATWACDGTGAPMDGLPTRMLAAYRNAGASFSAPGLSIFSLHLTGWLNWIELQMTIALGLRPDDPRDVHDAAQSVGDLFVWAQRIDGLPLLLDELQSDI